MLIFCWCNEISVTQLIPLLGISEKSIIDFYSFMREVCVNELSSANTVIVGGKGVIVEVDESHLHSRKYNKGRLLAKERESIWIFGGCERKSKKCFIVIMPDRKSPTLINVIKKHILPGSIIISDGWKAYDKVVEYGSQHFAVNHSANYVCPENPMVHTQNIERLWQSFKQIVPKKTNCKNLSSYCTEFMFRHNYLKGLTCGSKLKHMLMCISEQYPSVFIDNLENKSIQSNIV